jgi:hypothetical protein
VKYSVVRSTGAAAAAATRAALREPWAATPRAISVPMAAKIPSAFQ